jgi:hypothetical protein
MGNKTVDTRLQYFPSSKDYVLSGVKRCESTNDWEYLFKNYSSSES